MNSSTNTADLKLCDDVSSRENSRCIQFVKDGDVTRLDVWVSLQQRVSVRLRSPQINELIDWLVDNHPNGREEPK